MFDENSIEFGEGLAAGRTLEGFAGACPYMPGTNESMKKRLDWMAGFSRARDQVGHFHEVDDRPRAEYKRHQA